MPNRDSHHPADKRAIVCANCIHWFGVTFETGNCQRNAPVVIVTSGDTVFPLTRRADVCGQFEREPEKPNATTTDRL